MKKNFFKKEVDSLEVEIKHVKRENYTINQRHKHINEKFTDLEEETMETITEEKVFTECELACIAKITMRKHVNTKHECVHSDIGDKQIKLEKVQ